MTWKGAFIEWINEWPQLLGGYNWYTYHLIQLEFEDDRIMGAVETTIIILGFGFRARWNYKVTEKVADIQKAIEEIENGTAQTRPLSEFLSEPTSHINPPAPSKTPRTRLSSRVWRRGA